MSQRLFDRAMERMRGRDLRARQDAFDFLREHADSYAEALVGEFGREPDPDLRCWLLELVAEARSPAALPVFAAELENGDESLQFWAVRGLEALDSPAAEAVLENARAHAWIL